MAYYNVWRTDNERWVRNIEPIMLKEQDTDHPQKLSYVQARKVLECWRGFGGTGAQVTQVRILNSDDTPGDVVGFNVWMTDVSIPRWTNSSNITGGTSFQDTNNPTPSTYERATTVADTITIGGPVVMEIDSNLKPVPIYKPAGASSVSAPAPDQQLTLAPQQPVETKFDFEGYYGLKPTSSKFSYDQITKAAKVDPYTGLPIK